MKFGAPMRFGQARGRTHQGTGPCQCGTPSGKSAAPYAEKQLQESVSLLNATLESTADGILVISSEGVVRSFNQNL